MTLRLAPYPAYKDSGVPWLGDAPAHWCLTPGFSVFREEQRKNSGIAETRVLSLSYGRVVVKDNEKLHGLVPESFETYQIVEPGEIIIRPTDLQNDHVSLRVGAVRDRGIITSAYLCLRTVGQMHADYGYMLLHAYDIKKVFYGMGSGLRQNLAFGDFKRMPALLPPSEDQHAIVRFLDHADRRINRLIRAKRRLIELLNEQKQAIIHRAVTRGLDPNVRLRRSGIDWLGDVPERWEVKRLKWIALLHRGYDLPEENRRAGAFPVISSGGMIGTHDRAMAKAPGVVTGRYGSTGAIYFVESDFWPHNTSLFVSDFAGNDPRFVYYLLHTLDFGAHSAKSAVPGIDRKDLHDIVVASPLPPEQRAIAGHLDEKLISFEEATARVHRELDLLREYRTRLVADVVTGKLDVRGVELPPPDDDEPLDDVDGGDDANPGALDDAEESGEIDA